MRTIALDSTSCPVQDLVAASKETLLACMDLAKSAAHNVWKLLCHQGEGKHLITAPRLSATSWKSAIQGHNLAHHMHATCKGG